MHGSVARVARIGVGGGRPASVPTLVPGGGLPVRVVASAAGVGGN
ncbi:hypothetical protein BSIN_0949 [Burkholderia singularis]|uniref:Uncharacterized protein n=1 Tax=Burkholderia singularis TaxID=1503053 RepID=A0A238HAD0_9BURK|nr:hypothetical protein BSIN_0949 [Burkholderia singularis]